MMLPSKTVIAALLATAVSVLVTTWFYDAKIAGIVTAHEKERSTQVLLHAAAVQKQLTDSAIEIQKLNVLDSQKTKEMNHAQSDNDRLRKLYSAADSERLRLRITVRSHTEASGMSSTIAACSMGDGASVELSDAAGSTVWDIRKGMIGDQGKLAYLQGYVCTLRPDLPACVQPP